MRKMFFFLIVIIFALHGAESQEYISAQDLRLTSYVIPQIIYVGDRCRLVVNLGNAFALTAPFVSYMTEPQDSDIVISRIELDHRGGDTRLLIDFIPYNTGLITLPPVPISGDPPAMLGGLRINVASILDTQDQSLSGPASSLAEPGTGLLIYSLSAGTIIFLVLCIASAVWVKKHFVFLKKRFLKRHLLRVMFRLLRQLKISSIEGAGNAELFFILSREFREFLSSFTGIDCRALTPVEFERLDIAAGEAIKCEYLFELFSRWELLRFSGSVIGKNEFLAVLDEIYNFIFILDKDERTKKEYK